MDPLLCARCLAELTPGAGNFYRVKIEAVADPAPQVVSTKDLETDFEDEIKKLLAQMKDVSGQEALNQVYRRLTIYLCVPCYRQWIENPTGT